MLDTALRIAPDRALVRTARDVPTWILHGPDADPARAAALADAGVRLLPTAAGPDGLDLPAVLATLGVAGLTRILVEGGALVAGALLRADLVDRLAWFHAPAVMGGDGWPGAAPFGVARLAEMPRFRRVATRQLDVDMMSEYHREAP